MITDQPTQTTPPAPTVDTQLATFAELRDLLAQHPKLPALAWSFHSDRPGDIDAVLTRGTAPAIIAEYERALGGDATHGRPLQNKDGRWFISHCWMHTVGGLRFYLVGSTDVDAQTVFTLTHNDDPQEWTPAERAEYAALAGSAVAA